MEVAWADVQWELDDELFNQSRSIRLDLRNGKLDEKLMNRLVKVGKV